MKTFKKILSVALIIALFVCTYSTAFAKIGETYIVKEDGLRLRTQPKGGEGNEDNIIRRLGKGRKVLHIASKGNWWKVEIADGTQGWVFNEYLKADTTKESTITPKTAGTYTVKCEVLNVRKQPTTKSKKLGKLRIGRSVNVVAVKNGWGKIVNDKGQVGYIAMKYLI